MREGEKAGRRHPDPEDLEGGEEDGDESGGHEGEEEAPEPGGNQRKEERKGRQRQPTNLSRGPRLGDW